MANVGSKRLCRGQNVYVYIDGKETIGIIRSVDDNGDYEVAIDGSHVTVKKNEIQLLQRPSVSLNQYKTCESFAISTNMQLGRLFSSISM